MLTKFFWKYPELTCRDLSYTATKFGFMYSQEKELLGLSPNFHIHVSMSDLYISTFGPHIVLQQNGQTDQENI